MKKYYTILSTLLLLNACAGNKVDLESMSAEEIYNYAMDEMEKTRYAKAETAFEALETDHPYSQWAVRAKLMGAYAYYKDEKYDDAVMAVDRFIKYHPGNEAVPYALYLKGMCYYDQISEAAKDQGNTQKAAETFALLMTMYPESEYAKDAAGKINLTEDYKAGQEMIIGRYYLHEGNYLSALNRFNVVLENYQKTIQIEEALYRQVEIYAIFGLNNYAHGYYKILKQNYPEGKWTAKAEKVMNKIGIDTKPSKATADETATEKKSWFGGWFSGSDGNAEAAENKIEELKDEAETTVAEVQEEIATAETVADETANEKKSWFSGWFSGNEISADMAQSKKAADDAINEALGDVTGKTADNEILEESNNTANENSETTHSGWFGGLFSGGTLMGDDTAE